MTRALAIILALATSAPAFAASPAPPPPPPKMQKVLICLGFVGLAHHVSGMVVDFLGPPPPKTPVGAATAALVKATHGEGALIASEVRLVSKLPKKVIDAAARFCASRAGRAYAKVMNAGAAKGAFAKVSKDTHLVRLARRLVSVTRVADTGRDEAFLALRNDAGARSMVMRTRSDPKANEQARRLFMLGFKRTVSLGVSHQLHGNGPDLHVALVHATAATLAKTPRREIRAMIRFFESPAGKTIEQALVGAIHAAMDDAWARMQTRFETGKLAPKAGGR